MGTVDKGVIYIFFSVLLSAFNGAIAKILGDDMSALEIVFFRNLFGVVFLLISIYHTPLRSKGGQLSLLLLRGLLGFTAMFLFFYTIVTIPLGEAITLNKTSPLFVSILAFFLLGEKMSIKSIISLIFGFLGVLLISKPLGLSIGFEHLLGLIGGFLAAAAYTTIRKIKDIYESRSIMLSFMGVSVFVSSIIFLISSFYIPPSLEFIFTPFIFPVTTKVWLFLLMLGISATISQFLLTLAYSSSQAGIIGIVSYISIPFAVFFGVMLGDKIPDIYTFVGISFIVLSGLAVRSAKSKA
jgi:drug/metabolite transporter (DMT)-like permease